MKLRTIFIIFCLVFGYNHFLKDKFFVKDKQPSSKQAAQFGSGTGFFFTDNGYVVTNYHVVDDARTIKVYNSRYNGVTADVVRVDKENDMALLWVNKPSKGLPVTKFTVKKGEEIFVLGYPSPNVQGAQQKATFGRVNSTMGPKNDVRFFQIDSPVQPGNSGGPVFNKAGEVIGIATKRLVGEYQNVNYALKLDYLFPMLATVFSDLYEHVESTMKPKSGTLPQLVERYEDSVVMIVVEK